MKLDPGMHIDLHLVFFGKTGVTVTKHRLHQMAHTLGTTALHNLGRVWMVDVSVTVSGSF
jgi:hypothetical protein